MFYLTAGIQGYFTHTHTYLGLVCFIAGHESVDEGRVLKNVIIWIK